MDTNFEPQSETTYKSETNCSSSVPSGSSTINTVSAGISTGILLPYHNAKLAKHNAGKPVAGDWLGHTGSNNQEEKETVNFRSI